jgi:type I restriction enzyme S subunit
MAGKWVSRKIGSLGRVVTGKTPSTANPANFGGDYPFITIPDLDGRVFITRTARTLSEIGATAIRSSMLPPGSVMMSCIATAGKCGITTRSSFTNQQINSVIPSADADSTFLYYVFTQLGNQLESAGSGGSVYTNVSKRRFSDITVAIPASISEQRAVAHILSTLDDKIELNRRMIETLEAMARALFKSWFVDFDPVRAKVEGRDPGLPQPLADLFPSRLVDSELGDIPEGWAVGTVGEHMVNFDSKRIPVSGAARARRQGPYPYHGAAGVMDHVDDYLFDGIYLLVGEDGSVVQEAGVAVTQYVWGKIWVNNHAHVLQGAGPVSTEQLYLHFTFAPVAPYVTGAVQPKLSQGRMNSMPFLFPGDSLCLAFGNVMKTWFAKLRAGAEEMKTITALRDTLLPKLISGEVPSKRASTLRETSE